MSEQDFFFDEEPDDKASSAKGTSAKGSRTPAPAKAAAATPVAAVAVAEDSTTWAVAALIGVIGLLLGAILGFVLGTTLAGNSTATTAASVNAPAPVAGAQASPLTTEQISAGQLPAGHPAVNTSGAVDTSPTK